MYVQDSQADVRVFSKNQSDVRVKGRNRNIRILKDLQTAVKINKWKPI